MVYFRLLSDLHLEFSDGQFEVPHLDTDKDTVLVLAGDVAIADSSSTYKDFILDLLPRFRHIVYIMGNHEHYHGSLARSIVKIKRAVGEHDNLSVINNETVVIDNVAFVCSTLWTDFGGSNPLIMMNARQSMSDYRLIRIGPEGNFYARKLIPEDILLAHKNSVSYITEAIAEQKALGRVVVLVTHHGPSYQSVHEMYRGSTLNGAYVSNLDDMLLTLEPDYAVHGHTHFVMDYFIGKTHVMCNPRGYHGHETVDGFDPTLVLGPF